MDPSPGSDPSGPPPSTGRAASASPSAGAPRTPTAPGRPGTPAAPAAAPITLPTGGGAIRGIDEKVTVSLATGSGALSVPVATTDARHDFGPKLSLTYDSGAGNGPFGLGWRLSPPAITRRTARGVPTYQDGDGGPGLPFDAGSPAGDQDVFLLSDAEDLVPALVWTPSGTGTGQWLADGYTAGAFTVRRYRPRVEQAFTRIERWSDPAGGGVHWRCTTRDNVTSIYGLSPAARIADPDDPGRIFSWLLETAYDGLGNAVAYEYKPEDTTNVPATAPEHSRSRATNQYLKRIHYGPTSPYRPDQPDGPAPQWYYEVVLDYGDHDPVAPTPAESTGWPCRPDAFSSYRSGFEIRTRRLCRRILMFHSFPELGTDPVLVSSTDLTHTSDAPGDPTRPAYALLASVTRTGYLAQGRGYAGASMPPLELTYTPVQVDPTVRFAEAPVLANLPAGVDDANWQWIDVDGEGLPGVLSADDGAWYYQRNLSAAGSPDPTGTTLQLEPIAVLATKPAGTPASTRLSLTDLHGDGLLAAVDFDLPRPGYHARTSDGGWTPFTPFPSAGVDLADPNVRRMDLDGDGLADLLMTADDAFTWFAWLGQDGYAPGGRTVSTTDEEAGPALVFAAADGSIFTADMSGDGLPDLVRVRNGEICYWPNLGYGRFGAKVCMDGAPVFEGSDTFSARRVRLADLDGSGTADLVYLGTDGVRLWFNQSGNAFSAPTPLPALPGFDDASTVATLDLLGTGTTCLVWSTSLPGQEGRQLRYVDLMAAGKPHLLVEIVNNLGAQTTLEYATSTHFCAQDRMAGRPWITRLPFPVQVVARKETLDVVGGSRLVTTYAYHHGFFDGVEREFRGFAMVEQSDAEFVEADSGTGTFTTLPPAQDGEFVLPPARTCTWLHTGAFPGEVDLADALRGEYWAGDPMAPDPGPNLLPGVPEASAEDLREACRALRGRVLRTELYADDGTALAGVPYQVTASRYQVRALQPSLPAVVRSGESGGGSGAGTGPPTGPLSAPGYVCGAFLAGDLESVAYHYERVAEDPRVQQDLTLELDAYGTVVKAASIAYPRRVPAFPEQAGLLATYTEHDVTHVDTQPDWYRIAVPIETRQFEVGGLSAPAAGALLSASTVLAGCAVPDVGYEVPVTGAQRRLFARTRVIYRSDDLAGPLATGVVPSLALVDRTYTLTLTAGAATAFYTGRPATADSAAIAEDEGGFADLDADGSWWSPTPREIYSPDPLHPDPGYAAAHFYLSQGSVDPFGALSTTGWDAHDLVPVAYTDPVGNLTTAAVNYRVLKPWLVTDPNQNRSGARFDALGLVVALAVMGKALPGGGDEADHLDLSTPEAAPGDDPTQTFDHDLFAYRTWNADPSRDLDAPTPVWAHERSRVRHQDPTTPWLERYTYSDGLGRIALAKAQAEPGPAPQRDAGGALVRAGDGALVFANTTSRWVGSGRIVHDDKGNPVKSYEPFFDSTPAYESETDLVQWGVTAITRYDPLSRAIRVERPDGSFTSTEFDAWQRVESDPDDTVLASQWYAARSGGALGPQEQDAALKVAALAGTPQVLDLDPLGRVFRTVEDGPAGPHVTGHVLDIQGRVQAVVDALGRTAQTTDHDFGGTTLRTTSIDAGRRWTVVDAAANPLRQFDERGQQVRLTYDAARRPLATYLTAAPAAEIMCTQASYGEGAPGDVANNLRGAIHQQRDPSGIATILARDLHANVLTAEHQVTADPGVDADWSQPPALAPQVLTTSTTYDALSRVTSVTTPDGSVRRPTLNERSLLAATTVELAGGPATTFVVSVGYDAKAQRQQISYGNGAQTSYTYDPQTFRLTRLVTTRSGAAGSGSSSTVQDLTYTYDPVGNITRVIDGAQSTIFFANQLVAPVMDYTYDPLYALVRAAGREHLGQASGADDSDRRAVPLPTDAGAMQNYTQTYAYDLVGNLRSLTHVAVAGSWTRTYAYDEPSAAPATNHLTSTQVGAVLEPYGYDANGNLDAMPQLATITWDYRNQLRSTTSQVAADPATAPITWYRYDAAKSRVRKATTRADGSLAVERIYLGDFERYREYAPDGTVTLERVTLVVPEGPRRLALVETTTLDTSVPGGGAAPAAAPAVRYQFGDRLGSACVELDENAAVISYEEYFPYGSTSFQAGRSQAEVSLKRYRFTGRERDTETGLAYHGMRYYLPWLGRWSSCDPAGLIDGTGLYSYSRDNPVRLIDPNGTDGNDPVPEPVAPPAGPVSGFGITPPGTFSIFYPGGVNGTLASQSSWGLSGAGGGVVVGLTPVTQLQLSAVPLMGGQHSAGHFSGILFNGQLQLNTQKDPGAETTFYLFGASLSDQGSGGSQTVSGGTSVTRGQEWITQTDPDTSRFGANDYNHPRTQVDENTTLGYGHNVGGVRANSTFTNLLSLSQSVAWTRSLGYDNTALRPGGGTTASQIPRYTLGFDIYASIGLGALVAPDASGALAPPALGITTGVGADFTGSFTSHRADSAHGVGNNRLTLGWAVGPFVNVDGSGPGGGAAAAVGGRALFTISFGSGPTH